MARLASFLIFALSIALVTQARAQPAAPEPEGDQQQKPADDAKPDENVPADPDAPEQKDGPEKPPADAPPKPPPAPPTESKPASPNPPAKSGKQRPQAKKKKRSPNTAPKGAIIVALGPRATSHARALARAVYQDAALRPGIDERTAQVLSGGEAPADDAELSKHASVVRALGTTGDEEVQRRLAGSLARDLNARLVVLVSDKRGEPSARIVRMPEERMLAVTLTAKKLPTVKGAAPKWNWRDATSMMRELSIGAPPPGPRKKTKKKDGGGKATPVPEEGEDEGNLLTSPWFWGGLGLVVTVGATVLILSQTALNEPDVVMIDGRIAP